jgi:ribosomal-protein-alanine N-acetyltransferase
MNLPPYDLFPSLSNDRILLRQVLTSDVEEIIEISFYDCIQAKTLQEAMEMQGKIDKDYFEGNSLQWCIVDKSTNKIVGTCGYCRGFNK